VFLSSHSLDVVQELADRIAIVDRGRLIGCGTLEALRRQAAVDGSLEDVFLKLTDPGNGDAAARPAADGVVPAPLDKERLKS
jgi:ABC-2 type transport system ATP-binding protein